MVTIGVVLAAPPGSGSHTGAPFWSAAEARAKVMAGPVEMRGRSVRMDDVLCLGNGSLRIRSRGVFKYQHFNCLCEPARERRFWIKLHTLKSGWKYDFLHFQ